ncbi:hypothetical protein PanWU01x14_304310 [Parasponia andersonii]|uniref:Uncharacterized protein n=1 Tax=Parasponia andersonii TaxID=3476 RepID=A0A2P5ASL6_PARAD|nr:hypothetical protein PanWU01x14_304310 [Parasponia andersonii]
MAEWLNRSQKGSTVRQTLDSFGPVRPLSRQLGLPPEYNGPYLDSWGVGSLKGLLPEYNGKQLTTPDPDRAFNAILGRRAQGANRPDRMTIYKISSLTDSSRRRRQKSGYGDTKEITEISARDF